MTDNFPPFGSKLHFSVGEGLSHYYEATKMTLP